MMKRICAARGMTLAELAKRARLSQGYVSKLEVGAQRNPSVAIIRRLAKALGVPVAALLK
jgi:XRE family transcriptional regulator, master regulator for biofilm formation